MAHDLIAVKQFDYDDKKTDNNGDNDKKNDDNDENDDNDNARVAEEREVERKSPGEEKEGERIEFI